MRQALIMAVALAGCGSRPAAVETPDRPAPRRMVVLYSDAVEVRVRLAVDGAAIRELGELPPGDRYTIGGAGAGAARIVGPLPPPSFAGLANTRVTARSGNSEATGVVSEIGESSIVVRIESGPLRLDLPAEIEVDAPADIPATVELRGNNARGELQVSSWLGQLRWEIGYTAVIDGDGAGVELQGWLSLANDGDHTIVADQVAASIAAAEIGGPTAALVIDRRLSLAAGDTVELPLFPRPLVVPGSVVLVFDPVGDRLDHEGRRPVSRPSYGANRGTDVIAASVALELGLDALGRLPGGRLSVLRRGDRGLVPLGDGLGFADPASSSQTFEPGKGSRADSGTGRVIVARSSEVSGRRWQEDFSYDPRRRRLVEEIRVELDNRGDAAAVVDVREHQYRGLNWAIVYHNEAGRLTKTSSQEIRFDVSVPPRSKRLVAYRVAYTW
jgi:hypothetical protein